MTREEVIQVLHSKSVEISGNVVNISRFFEALDIAIAILHDVADTDVGKNEPLTLDELRKMYDDEEGAVWVKNGRACFPAILDIYDGELVAVWSAEPDYFEERHYGKNWLAYRQKPEEGTNE